MEVIAWLLRQVVLSCPAAQPHKQLEPFPAAVDYKSMSSEWKKQLERMTPADERHSMRQQA